MQQFLLILNIKFKGGGGVVMEAKVKEFNPSFPVETQQQNKLDLYQI